MPDTPISSSDVAAGADAVSLIAITAADTATGTDAVTAMALGGVSETATGTDAVVSAESLTTGAATASISLNHQASAKLTI